MGVAGPEITQEVVTYWVRRGYDSDELGDLGKRKSVEFLVEMAERWPEMDNDILLVHITAFIQQLTRSVRDRNAKQLKRLEGVTLRQVMRLNQSLRRMHGVKASKEI